MADRAKLKIPVAGQIFLGYAVSRFCRVLGTLLRNGVPLLQGAGDQQRLGRQPRACAQAIRASAENVSSGETLAQPAGGVRTDSATGHGHDQRRRGIEQSGQRADQYRRRPALQPADAILVLELHLAPVF